MAFKKSGRKPTFCLKLLTWRIHICHCDPSGAIWRSYVPKAYAAKMEFFSQLQPCIYASWIVKPYDMFGACAVIIAEVGRLDSIIVANIRKMVMGNGGYFI